MGTRRFNSLKLWMALKFMGRAGYAESVERHIDLTDYLANRIDQLKDFQRLGEVETAVCCLRFLPPAIRDAAGTEQDRMQQRLQQRIERGGEAWLTTTVLQGRRALRVNINSFLTERRHIDESGRIAAAGGSTSVTEENKMNNAEMQKNIEFIISQQAQFSVDIRQLKEAQVHADARMTRIEGQS